MRTVGSNSWTVLWMCAPKVIQSNVTPAPRSLVGALTVTLRALTYQSGQAVAWTRCSQIFAGGAAITMSLWAKRSACSGTMPSGQRMCAERCWMSSMTDMIVPPSGFSWSSRSGDCVPAIVMPAGLGSPPPEHSATGQVLAGRVLGRSKVAEGLARPVGIRAGGQYPVELAAGADAELGEHVAEVVLGGAGADKQPGADLRVGQPLTGQPRHLSLLRGQPVVGPGGPGGAGGRGGAGAAGLAGRPQLARGPFGERLHAHLLQQPVGGAQLLPRVLPATLPAQPFAVQQVRAGQLSADPGPAQPLDRLPVGAVGGLTVAEQSPDPGLNAQYPLGRGHPGAFRQPVQRRPDARDVTGAGRRLGQLNHDPGAEPQLVALEYLPGGVPRGFVPAQAAVQHRARARREPGRPACTVFGRHPGGVLDQLGGFLLPPPQSRQHRRGERDRRVAGGLSDQAIFLEQPLRRAQLAGE